MAFFTVICIPETADDMVTPVDCSVLNATELRDRHDVTIDRILVYKSVDTDSGKDIMIRGVQESVPLSFNFSITYQCKFRRKLVLHGKRKQRPPPTFITTPWHKHLKIKEKNRKIKHRQSAMELN